MDVHQNARTTRHSRMLMVERLATGWSVSSVAAAFGVDPRTVRKWRDRFAAEGTAGLCDRSSRPRQSPRRLDEATVAEIATLRRQRLSGPVIARRLGRPVSTIGLVLRRQGLARLSALDPKPPVVRYERDRPGELIHIDIKKLGRIDGIGHRITGDRRGQSNKRGTGWEHLHVAIDDHSRLAYTELLPDEKKESALGFLARALAWYERHGVTVEGVMTDNGSAYKSHAFRDALAAKAITHKRTRPYTPRTNGKAERFIQTSLREWAKPAKGSDRRSLLEWLAEGYATPFESSAERARAMPAWLCDYNRNRPHSALNGKPPVSRLAKDNLLVNDI